MHQFEVAFEWLGAWGISIKVARKVCEEGVLFPYQKKVHEEEENDRMVWMDSKKGFFSVKYLYSILELVCIILFPLGIIWNSWVPPKMSIFWLSKVTSKRCWPWILFRRESGCSQTCLLCKNEGKSIDHILLHCAKVRELSKLLFSLLALYWSFLLWLGRVFKLVWFFWGKKPWEGLESRFSMYFFWGNLKGKWGATDSIAKLLFLRSLVS